MNKRILFSICYIVLGIACLVLSILGLVPNTEFISGFGGSFIAIGVIRFLQYVKYTKSEEYRHKVEIYEHDERLAYLNCAAWQIAGRISVFILAICCIVSCFVAPNLVGVFSTIVCGITLIYYVSYIYVSHKH